jgi:hypothetical protein
VDPKAVAAGLGAFRIAVGTSLLVAPRLAQRVWLGPGRRAPRVAAALAARDLLVGALTLRAVVRDEPVAQWLRVGAAVDAADGIGHVLAGARLPTGRRVVVPGGALGAAALGWWAGARPA